jgi:hypothetical protein
MKSTPRIEIDRGRRKTSPEQLQKIDEQIERNVRLYASQPGDVIARRINELQNEWSLERRLETNASILMLVATLLGLTSSKKWLLLNAVVGGFLLQYAISGWCPPVQALRRMGVRKRSEIEREIYALKAARGDFKNVPAEKPRAAARPLAEIMQAVHA